ncbi:hypothetical protein DFH09DRAFT_587019 [Mycena vulgaris]|nr:hypothetical protein DFH09DRAFT_587019 [Mycena vulgaris]
MQFVFSVNAPPETASKPGTRSSKRLTGTSNLTPAQKRLKMSVTADPGLSDATSPSIADLPRAGNALVAQIDKIVEAELQMKRRAVNEAMNLRQRNDKLVSDAKIMEKTSESLRQQLGEAKIELLQLRKSANSKEQKAKASRKALELELVELRRVLGDARENAGRLEADKDQLKNELLGLRHRLSITDAEFTEEKAKSLELGEKSRKLDEHWSDLQSNLSDVLATSKSKYESMISQHSEKMN